MTDNTEKLLDEIKSLLILQLAKTGVKSEEVAKALGCGASTLRKKFRWEGRDGKRKK